MEGCTSYGSFIKDDKLHIIFNDKIGNSKAISLSYKDRLNISWEGEVMHYVVDQNNKVSGSVLFKIADIDNGRYSPSHSFLIDEDKYLIGVTKVTETTEKKYYPVSKYGIWDIE